MGGLKEKSVHDGSVQCSLMENAFGDYVKSVNLENMFCDRQYKTSSDLARVNSWIMDLELARAAVYQETEDNENDDIKKKSATK